MPSWYPKAKKLAAKFGIELEDKDGGMGGALLFMVIVGIPLVAAIRLGLIYVNQYFLAWAASHTVTDLRVDLLR